jgi:hypothetical protein
MPDQVIERPPADAEDAGSFREGVNIADRRVVVAGAQGWPGRGRRAVDLHEIDAVKARRAFD